MGLAALFWAAFIVMQLGLARISTVWQQTMLAACVGAILLGWRLVRRSRVRPGELLLGLTFCLWMAGIDYFRGRSSSFELLLAMWGAAIVWWAALIVYLLRRRDEADSTEPCRRREPADFAGRWTGVRGIRAGWRAEGDAACLRPSRSAGGRARSPSAPAAACQGFEPVGEPQTMPPA